MEVLAPCCASVVPRGFEGILESIGVENGELCVGRLLTPTTGNRGCDTGTGGIEAGSPGGVTCEG